MERTENKGKNRIKKIIWILGVIITVFILAVIAFHRSNGIASLQFKTAEVKDGDLTVTVSATGQLKPVNQVEVGTEVSGTIETVFVDYNDRVKANQVMAKLDTAKLEAEVLQSQAALESARAQLHQAEADLFEARNQLKRLEHVLELSGGKVPSQQDLDAAEAAFKRAQAKQAVATADIARAEANLNFNKTNLDKAIIYSPIDGIVLERAVEPGQTVAASLQTPVLFSLAEDLTQMELHVDVDEADVGRVREGQEASFTVDAYPDRTFPAQVLQVRYGPQTIDGVVTYTTVLAVDNSDLLLRPGMTATADIIVRKVENVTLVPNAALRFTPPEENAKQNENVPPERGNILSKIMPRPPRHVKRSSNQRPEGSADSGQRVWTLENGKLVPIPVKTGATDGVVTELIICPLKPGTAIVVGAVSINQ
ncbi:MAG: efflux RND transporter periplasmic adaptor subunit [Deltaproteobacteria bacterium]|nr:efflux RND transporter periplasmic adaptor subunit [Deltaproteobacteria bacterium]